MVGLQLQLDTRTPEEIDGPKEDRFKPDYDSLGNTLQKKWEDWSTNRREKEEEWLEDLRAFNQQNDPDIVQLSKFHSHIYMGVTRTKCLGAYSRIVDLMFGKEAHWGFSPTPVPESESPEIQMFMEEMERRAELMQEEVKDQQIDLGYDDHVKSAVLEACILGTGCVKGVVPGVKKIEKWGFTGGIWDVIKQEIPFPQIASPSIFNLYPDPYATRIKDASGIFERHVMNRQQFSELKDDSRFDEEKIEYILKVATEGNHTALWHETERRSIAKVSDTTAQNAERFDVLEYWGQVSGHMLAVNGVEVEEETDTYWANVWVCNGFSIFAQIMPMKRQRIPYNFFTYDKVPHQFWGISPGRKARSSQLGINGVVRSILDGMAMVAVPMAEVNVHMLKDGEDPRAITPGRVFLREKGDPAYPAVSFFQPSVPTGQLIQMGEMFQTYSDDESNIPRYTYGDTSGEINQTKGGMQLQMNAATLPIKAVVKNLEDGLIHPLLTSWYDWNMEWSDREEIKGDMEIDVLGTSSLIAKDQKANQIMHFLSVTANPLDAPIIDRKYLYKELAKTLELDPDKSVPDQQQQSIQQDEPNILDMAKAKLIQAQTEKTQAETSSTKGKTLYELMQTGQVVATVPGVAPIADSLGQSIGFNDENGPPLAQEPQQPMNIPQTSPQNTSPMYPPVPQSASEGIGNGIETPKNDGTML